MFHLKNLRTMFVTLSFEEVKNDIAFIVKCRVSVEDPISEETSSLFLRGVTLEPCLELQDYVLSCVKSVNKFLGLVLGSLNDVNLRMVFDSSLTEKF